MTPRGRNVRYGSKVRRRPAGARPHRPDRHVVAQRRGRAGTSQEAERLPQPATEPDRKRGGVTRNSKIRSERGARPPSSRPRSRASRGAYGWPLGDRPADSSAASLSPPNFCLNRAGGRLFRRNPSWWRARFWVRISR